MIINGEYLDHSIDACAERLSKALEIKPLPFSRFPFAFKRKDLRKIRRASRK